MQLHQLKPNHKKKSRKRVGRGGKKGTYVGRGLKGQKSRAGKQLRYGFAGGDTTFIKRLPKKRGMVGSTELKKGVKLSRYKSKIKIFNLKDINQYFKAGDIVSPKTLSDKGLIETKGKKIPLIKILGTGELKNKLVFKDVRMSKSVKDKIE